MHVVCVLEQVTVADAIARVNSLAATKAGATPPLPLSGTLHGAHIDGPTPEIEKAAAVALAAASELALLVLGDSEKSCGAR